MRTIRSQVSQNEEKQQQQQQQQQNILSDGGFTLHLNVYVDFEQLSFKGYKQNKYRTQKMQAKHLPTNHSCCCHVDSDQASQTQDTDISIN